MTLSIVVLNYNTPDLTSNCIASVLANFSKEIDASDFEIVTVDNNSTDKSWELLEKKFANKKNVRLVRSKTNLGFGGGCNLGSQNSIGKYVLFLNSDTEVKDKKVKDMITKMKENSGIGIIGGKVLDEDESPSKSTGNFMTLTVFIFTMLGFERLGFFKKSPEKFQKVDWVEGSFFMVDKEKFHGLGGFDEKMFLYAEDMELCYRAAKKGIETYFYPGAKIIHKKHGSSSRAFAVAAIYSGILYFYKKHMPGWKYSLVRFILTAKAIILVMFGRVFKNKYLVEAYSQALSHI